MNPVGGVERAPCDGRPRIPTRPTTDSSASREAGQALTVLTSVAVVCRSRPRVGAIAGVVQTIDRFVGVDARWTVSLACKADLPGQFRLLRRLAAQEDPEMDPLLKRKHFSGALDSAIQRDNFELVKWLVDEYLPRGRIRDELEYAASQGQSRSIRWLWEHHRDRVVWTPMLVCYAATNDHLELARWLHAEIGLQSLEAKEMIKAHAICNGCLALLQWVIELGARIRGVDIQNAARYGHVPVLEWLARVQNVRVSTSSQSLVAAAVPRGHIEAVEWIARQPGVNFTLSGNELADAPPPFIFWALENLQVKDKERLARVINVIASCNDIESVKFLHENSNGGSCTIAAMDNAASAGHLEMVKWLHENRSEGCTTRAMDGAAEHGHLDVVKWLHEHRTEGCTTAAMDAAADCGNLEMVKWLHSNRREGCTSRAMDFASRNSHLDVIQWLHNNRHEGCTAMAIANAAKNGRLDVLQWLHFNRTEGCTTRAMDYAATYGHLEVVQWLHANRHEGCTTAAMDGAADSGRLDIVQWLHNHRTEGCTVGAMAKAAYGGHIQVAQWLVESGRVRVTWEVVMALIGCNWVEAVKWMLPRLLDAFDFRLMVNVKSLEMAQVLHADGRLPFGSKDYRRALGFGDWQFFQWLLREYPDAMLRPRDVEELMEQGVDDVKRQERVRQAYMQDAISELAQLRGE